MVENIPVSLFEPPCVAEVLVRLWRAAGEIATDAIADDLGIAKKQVAPILDDLATRGFLKGTQKEGAVTLSATGRQAVSDFLLSVPTYSWLCRPEDPRSAYYYEAQRYLREHEPLDTHDLERFLTLVHDARAHERRIPTKLYRRYARDAGALEKSREVRLAAINELEATAYYVANDLVTAFELMAQAVIEYNAYPNTPFDVAHEALGRLEHYAGQLYIQEGRAALERAITSVTDVPRSNELGQSDWIDALPLLSKSLRERQIVRVGACTLFSDTSIPMLLMWDKVYDWCRHHGLEPMVFSLPWDDRSLTALDRRFVVATVYNTFETVRYMRRTNRWSFRLFRIFNPVSAKAGGNFYLLANQRRDPDRVRHLTEEYAKVRSTLSPAAIEVTDCTAESGSFLSEQLVPFLQNKTIVVPQGDMLSTIQIFLEFIATHYTDPEVELVTDYNVNEGFHLFITGRLGDLYFGGQDQRVLAGTDRWSDAAVQVVDARILSDAGLEFPLELRENALVISDWFLQSNPREADLLAHGIIEARRYIRERSGVIRLGQIMDNLSHSIELNSGLQRNALELNDQRVTEEFCYPGLAALEIDIAMIDESINRYRHNDFTS